MGAFWGLIIFVVVIILFFKFPKRMSTILGISVAAIVLLWIIFVTVPEQERKKAENSVKVSIIFDNVSCGADFPLKVKIQNDGFKKVNKVTWV